MPKVPDLPLTVLLKPAPTTPNSLRGNEIGLAVDGWNSPGIVVLGVIAKNCRADKDGKSGCTASDLGGSSAGNTLRMRLFLVLR